MALRKPPIFRWGFLTGLGWALPWLFASMSSPASAHEKWFINAGGHPLRWDLFFRPLPVVLIGVVLIVTFAASVVWRARHQRSFLPGPTAFGATFRGKSILYRLLPVIIGVHFAVPLLVDGTHTRLFSPNDRLTGLPSFIVGLSETFIALSFFYGGLTRVSAGLLAVLWLAGFWLVGPEATLENSVYLGVAVFFWMAGRGPIAIDRILLPKLEPPAALARHAIVPLRIGLGVSLIVVAFTEKLANQPLAFDFLQAHPLNFTAALGLPLSDELFVLAAGCVELLVGLWILLGIFNREIVIFALLPFNLTLSVFNETELVGHLPFYGILAVLLVWESGSTNRQEWLSGLSGVGFTPDEALSGVPSLKSRIQNVQAK